MMLQVNNTDNRLCVNSHKGYAQRIGLRGETDDKSSHRCIRRESTTSGGI